MMKEENPTNLTYYLADCAGSDGKMSQVIHVSYNVKQQDLFEVELSYGNNLEHQINELNETDKQEIYKKLVLVNYL